ncbi:MAG: PQQ-dependent sugar dehydrogenase [Pseudomonadota bacterium]
MKKRLTISLAALVLIGLQAFAQAETLRTEYQMVELDQLAEGLSNPWGLAVLPDGRFLITEKPGRLVLIDGDTSSNVSGTPEVMARGQGGLLDVVIHPDFESNGLVYLTWSKPSSDGNNSATALSRGKLEGNALLEIETIFVQDRYSQPGRHYGSRLAWMHDGTLLMSIGDRGAEPPRSQDLGDHAGALLRLNEDGTPAEDNPFIGRDDVLPEIYSYGHRNIQGLFVHPQTGEIWATEHGPRGGDELNNPQPGKNYGWPQVSLGRDYRSEARYFEYTERSHPDMVDSLVDWTPGIAPSGLAVLTGDEFPRWQGNVLSGGLHSEQIRRIVFEDGVIVHQEELIRGQVGRIRDVRVGDDGLIYLITDNGEGNDGLYRISPAG